MRHTFEYEFKRFLQFCFLVNSFSVDRVFLVVEAKHSVSSYFGYLVTTGRHGNYF
jgi:hypothetical protein